MRILLTALLAVLLLAPARAAASEVRDKLDGFAKEIQRLLKDEGQTQVAIGEFTGPPLPKTSAGPLIQIALIDALKARKVSINDEAFVFVKGEYFVLDEDSKKDALTVRLLATVRTKKGKKIDELSTDIGYRGNDDIVKLLAMNTDQSKEPKANREKQNKQLRDDLNSPPLFLDGTKIKTTKDSLFAVEVLVRAKGEDAAKARTPSEDKSQAFIDLKKGEEYELRLTSHTKFETAVSVTIDGVDAFQFYEGAGKPRYFLIPAGKTITVKGWARDTKKVSAFLVGSFAESAAAKALKGSALIGTMTVCFHPSWKPGEVPPDFKGARTVDDKATGIGRDIKQASTVVPRTIGPQLTAVSVRYKK